MNDKRLDRLMPALTAKERAILVLEDLRVGNTPDPMIVHATPPERAKEFSRLLGLINAVNVELSMGIVVLREQVKQTALKMAWLQSIRMCALDMSVLAGYIALETDEPITESGWKERQADLAQDADDIDVIVEHVVYDGVWLPQDLDADGDPQPQAVDRRWAEVEPVVRDAITAGDLPASGRGKRKIRWSDLAVWTNTEMPVFPDWGRAYDVHPDAEAHRITTHVEYRRAAERIFDQAPKRMHLPLDDLPQNPEDVEPTLANLPLVLVSAVRRDFLARAAELAAIEQVIQAIADDELDGHSPLDDAGHAIVDETRGILDEVRVSLAEYIGEIELPLPVDEDVQLVWGLIRRAAE